jgi:hypothetical protein
MKKLFLAGLFSLGMGAAAHAISLDINTVQGTTQNTSSRLNFAGDGTFTFENATTGANAGYDFVVSGSTGGFGDSFGLYGNIGGTFSIGAPAGSPEMATVTSSPNATLSIFDGTNTFIGDIDWLSLERDGTSGDFNISAQVNLTNIVYSGTFQDLIALKGALSTASATIAFSFNPEKSITQLKTQSLFTSYSGDLASVPDGGATVALFGLSLLGLTGVRRFVK